MAHRKRPTTSGSDLTKYNKEHAKSKKTKKKNAPITVGKERRVKGTGELQKWDGTKWVNSKKYKLQINKPSKQDQEDAKKEEATSKIIKKKPKGGYSRENTKDPGPGEGRKATLEEDREKTEGYKPGDLTKNPKKAYYSPELGRYVTGAGIKAKAAADRKEMLKNKRKKDTQKKLETAYDQGKKDGTPKKEKKSEPKKSKPSTVFTRHYKTGKELGVMTRSQRRKYDAEAAGRTFESEVSKHEKESGHGKAHKRETLYKSSQRKKPKKKITLDKIKDDLKIKPKETTAPKPKAKETKAPKPPVTKPKKKRKYPRKVKNQRRGF